MKIFDTYDSHKEISFTMINEEQISAIGDETFNRNKYPYSFPLKHL